MEADLQRFYGVDLRDWWRRDEHGRRLLTLRRLRVLLSHTPVDAAWRTTQEGAPPPVDLVHVLLADVWQAVARSKRPHPLIADARKSVRQQRRRVSSVRRRKVSDARRRAQERRRRIEAGEIT